MGTRNCGQRYSRLDAKRFERPANRFVDPYERFMTPRHAATRLIGQASALKAKSIRPVNDRMVKSTRQSNDRTVKSTRQSNDPAAKFIRQASNLKANVPSATANIQLGPMYQGQIRADLKIGRLWSSWLEGELFVVPFRTLGP